MSGLLSIATRGYLCESGSIPLTVSTRGYLGCTGDPIYPTEEDRKQGTTSLRHVLRREDDVLMSVIKVFLECQDEEI